MFALFVHNIPIKFITNTLDKQQSNKKSTNPELSKNTHNPEMDSSNNWPSLRDNWNTQL
jgi:hypothetical protein